MNYKNIINLQKDLAANLLGDIQRVFGPSAILAGGALRDWEFERFATDLDFYVKCTSSPLIIKVTERMNLTEKQKRSFHVMGSHDYSDNTIKEVVQGWIDGQCVQIISVSGEPKDQIHRFSASISQIYWDGENTIKSEMNKSLTEKGAILVGESKEYSSKIGKKFPNFSFSYRESYQKESREGIIECEYAPYAIVDFRSYHEIWEWDKEKPGQLLGTERDYSDSKDFIQSLLLLEKGIDISKTQTNEDHSNEL